MVATILLSLLIFGSCGWIIYRKVKVKGKAGCDDCHCSCPANKNELAK